jgi:predicted acetyltransferase
MAAPEVTLELAKVTDTALLSNLLELYIHDLSAVFPDVEMGPDGRFGYSKLPLFWTEPERGFPFLITINSRAVGFALVTLGSPASDDPHVFDIAEFFVTRAYRRSGVGRKAALLLWNRLQGSWTVRASEGNPGACAFWRRIIAEFTGGTAVELGRPGSPHGWRVFFFASTG